MKRIAAGLFFFFMVMTPRGFAQVVVGDYNPEPGGGGDVAEYNYVVSPTESTDLICNFLSGCTGYQPFSLSSGTYVNEIDIMLANWGSSGGTVGLNIVIHSGATDGPTVLGLSETLTVPNFSSHVFLIPASITFSRVWLPAGSYYMTVFGSVVSGCTSCNLQWAVNGPGSTKIGNVGQALFYDADPSTDGGSPFTAVLNRFDTDNTLAFTIISELLTGAPVGVTGAFFGPGLSQILHLVAGPITPSPGTPVEAQLGFLDMNGNLIGPTSRVTINPGETQSLDLNASQFVNQFGQRIEVRPVITFLPNPAGAAPAVEQLSASVQILDALSGFGTVLEPLAQPGASASSLVPQILAGGQTMRFNAVAGAANSCTGQISFADNNGSPMGPSMPLNLAPNAGTSLDLNADSLSLKLGQHIEVQPILTVTPQVTAGPPLNSVCLASVEVFDHLSGRTWTYQSASASLPAAQ